MTTKTKSEIAETIAKQRTRRQSNKVLHVHPSPLLWVERDVDMARVFAQRKESAERVPRITNVYVSTPYCIKTEPERCGFCLFPSEDFKGQAQLTEYLGYLKREADLLRPHYEGADARSLYFGGGTANLYRAEAYAGLVALFRDLYALRPDAEITLEGIPQLFTREKLAAMKEAGVTRISVGAQQLSTDLIALSGRRQTAAQVFDTISAAHELGLEVSIDLIFGWPRQTMDRMLEDLRAVCATGIRHLTHYELNVAGRSDFARNHRDTLPSIEQNLELYTEAKRFLESEGFRQVTAYDWERASDAGSGRYAFEDNLRRIIDVDAEGRVVSNEMQGVGFAAITIDLGDPRAPGWSRLNSSRVADYFAGLDRGELPIERGYRHAPADARLVWLFQALQAMRIDRVRYARIFERDVVEDFAPVWAALGEIGWAETSKGTIDLVGEGVFFTPIVQTLLAADRVEQIRRSISGREDLAGGSRLVQVRTPARVHREREREAR